MRTSSGAPRSSLSFGALRSTSDDHLISSIKPEKVYRSDVFVIPGLHPLRQSSARVVAVCQGSLVPCLWQITQGGAAAGAEVWW